MAAVAFSYPRLLLVQHDRATPLLPGYTGDWADNVDFGLGYDADGCRWVVTDLEGWYDGAPASVTSRTLEESMGTGVRISSASKPACPAPNVPESA